MSRFKYADDKITSREIMIAVASMSIGVGILETPSLIAQETKSSDGWIALLVSGGIVIGLAWAIAKIASKFPGQSFRSYASTLVSKPIAYLLTVLFSIEAIAITAYEVRMITDISHEYLFERTPLEVVALSFLLVVIYAISGSRAGIFRLNAMFLPIIFFMTGLLVFFSIRFMEGSNLLPVFTTDMKEYFQGVRKGGLAYTGFGILFFYMALVRDAKKAPGRAAIGMSSVVLLYIILYITCIAIFGQPATEVIRLPVIELAKSIEVPGGFLDRMESVFFVIWITAIFTTAMMAFDITVFALTSLFPKVKKIVFIFSLAPLIMFLSMLPNDYLEMSRIGNYISTTSVGLSVGTVILLWIMYGIRGGKQRGK